MMAAKDWIESDINEWHNSKEFLKIRKIEWNSYYSTHWFKKNDVYMVYMTQMDWPLSVTYRKGFKTKTEALKYAKLYMRTH